MMTISVMKTIMMLIVTDTKIYHVQASPKCFNTKTIAILATRPVARLAV